MKRLYGGTASWIRSRLNDLYWRIAGKEMEIADFPGRVLSILFVCSGNICRSPFAEGYFRRFAGKKCLTRVQPRSPGLDVRRCDPAPDAVVRIARIFDVDLAEHRSKPIAAGMIEESDIVLVVEHRQQAVLERCYPAYRSRIFLLPLFYKETFVDGRRSSRYNIPDPYGKSEERFLDTFCRIARCVDGLAFRMHPGSDSE